MMMRQPEKIRHYLQHVPRVVQFCCYTGLLFLAMGGWALSGGAGSGASLLTPLIPLVSPMYLEKSANPLEFNQGTGWQLGGINSQFDANTGNSTLSLRGGLFYSRALGPRRILDSSTPVPDNRFGQQLDAADTRSLSMPQGLLFGNSRGRNAVDQVTYQRMSYQGHGLSLSGNYAQVGKEFQGINELVQQMTPGDPQGAALLGLGMTRSNFNAVYSGIYGLELVHNTNALVNQQLGNQEYGLSRTEQENRLLYNFGERRSLTYRRYSKDDEWDPTIVKKDAAGLQQEQIILLYGLGAKSQFSLNQTATATTAGAAETDVREHSLALSWNEWQNFSFTGGYTKRVTEQTDQVNRILNLALSTSLLPHVQISGNLTQNETSQSNAALVKNNQANLSVTARLTPSVQICGLYQNVDAPDKGQVITRDQQLTWAQSPQWTLASRLLNTDSSNAGSSDRLEYSLTGRLGTQERAEQVCLLTRTDSLPNDARQTRREVSYLRAFGSKEAPVALRVQVGQYDLTQQDTRRNGNLLTVQLLTLRPLPHTTMSLGYYAGPTLGANYLAYRSWGQKPPGNLELWNPTNFMQYSETGSEITYALTGSTKLVLKQLFGERADTGRADTSEYGVEQQVGPVKLLAGRRNTAQPGDAPDLKEDWWQVNLTKATPLPAWAVNSTRQMVFGDSAAWGLAQPPAWVTAPAAGLSVERRHEIAIANCADVYTARFARMLGRRLFLQADYDRNPRKTDKPNEVEFVERGICHLGYAVRPNLLAYTRYVRENRLDVQPDLLTRSIGVVGTLSKNEKLHLQVDLLTRTTGGKEEWGTAYMAGYERTVNPEDTFSLKYRYQPEEFSTPENYVRLEASFQHAF